MSSESILGTLLPELQLFCREHRKRAIARGINTFLPADGGRRSADRQIELFGHGRDFVDGYWIIVDPNDIVTNARPEQAPHCRGAAYDLVPLLNGRAAWDRIDLLMELGRIGMDLGLVWGGSWKKIRDLPHYELKNWRNLPYGE